MAWTHHLHPKCERVKATGCQLPEVSLVWTCLYRIHRHHIRHHESVEPKLGQRCGSTTCSLDPFVYSVVAMCCHQEDMWGEPTPWYWLERGFGWSETSAPRFFSSCQAIKDWTDEDKAWESTE
ncbi:unnamed protein product [Durusdinium trenchii]|uniref:Uncharacterized protein n=1 Tax=Durusdinium trenchii TaxID=1381693 RepID=A0ABP0MTP4_9DINO